MPKIVSTFYLCYPLFGELEIFYTGDQRIHFYVCSAIKDIPKWYQFINQFLQSLLTFHVWSLGQVLENNVKMNTLHYICIPASFKKVSDKTKQKSQDSNIHVSKNCCSNAVK